MLRAVVCLPKNMTFLATRNRATMPSLGKISYYKHQSLPGATGIIFRGKQRFRGFCRVTQTKSNPNFVPLLVVEGSSRSLFGRDWLSRIRLDWTKICNIRVSETDLPQCVASQFRRTIQNHPNLFKPGLGTVKGITAKLEMKPDARPKFCKARPVSYALQEAVEAEYNRLESEGIVERVEFSEWATPMVHVPKADGTTRSCGDYAVTVNPQLHVPQYPIPLPEDVFLKLRGGQRFTKVDFKSAYQLPLDPESQRLLPSIRTAVFSATKGYPSVLRLHLLCSSALWTSSFRV